MKLITWAVRITFLAILLWLAMLNNQTVVFSVLKDMAFEFPLIVLLFGFLIAGVLLGVLMVWPKNVALHWEARKLRKELDAQKNHSAQTLSQHNQDIQSLKQQLEAQRTATHQAASTPHLEGGQGRSGHTPSAHAVPLLNIDQ